MPFLQYLVHMVVFVAGSLNEPLGQGKLLEAGS